MTTGDDLLLLAAGNGTAASILLYRKLEAIEMKLDELVPVLNGLSDQLTKVQTEITGKLDELEAALANPDLPAEVQPLVDGMRESLASLDGLVPDVEPSSEA